MIKQVIVIRKDLRNENGQKIRTGKLISQACHASLGAFLKFGMNKKFSLMEPWMNGQNGVEFHIEAMEGSSLYEWYYSGQTKITVSVNSEEELMQIYEAIPDHIPCHLVTDLGRTEFNGVPTVTCLGIGPAPAEIIDPITGHLPLL